MNDADFDPITQNTLFAHMSRLSLLITEIQAEAKRRGANHITVILDQYRAQVYRAVTSLGEWVDEFLAEHPSPTELRLVRQQVVETLRGWSSTSPILQYILRTSRSKGYDPEAVRQLFAEHPAGADVPALVLNDYYKHCMLAQAARGRVQLFIEAMTREVAQRAAAGSRAVRILVLHTSGARELITLAQDATFTSVAQITCLDEHSQSLREVARSLPSDLRGRCSLVRMEALQYIISPGRPARPFDIIYGLSNFEHLEPELASRLIQGCHSLLAPGGTLLVGSVTADAPAGERVLLAWLTEWEIQYRNEAVWRQLFKQSGFGAARLQFMYEPLRVNVLISAERA